MAKFLVRSAQALALSLIVLAGVAAITPTVFADCPGTPTGGCKDAGTKPQPAPSSPFASLLVWLASLLG